MGEWILTHVTHSRLGRAVDDDFSSGTSAVRIKWIRCDLLLGYVTVSDV